MLEYFFAIIPMSTLTQSGITCYGPTYRSNRTVQLLRVIIILNRITNVR